MLMSSEEILDLLFKELTSVLSRLDIYAIKGGYIMSHYIARGMRYSSDIDLSIKSKEDFESIKNIIVPILDSLKSKGQIGKYKIKEPVVSNSTNISGCFKLYRRFNENTPYRLLCGIDVSVHNLSFGIITLEDGVFSFSLERMLSDKISILYKDINTIIRRCRDLYDIFLFNTLSVVVYEDTIKECFKYRNVNIKDKSNLEMLSEEDLNKLYVALNNFLEDGSKVNLDYIQENNISTESIINVNLSVLDFLRRSL